jgi:prepilin-type N-terminal cleavage/methylation domain-containing protein
MKKLPRQKRIEFVFRIVANEKGFKLIELLVVVSIISILAALLLPTLRRGNADAKRAFCIGNVREINLGICTYASDWNDLPPTPTNSAQYNWNGYATVIGSYVGMNGPVAGPIPLFECPADTFYYEYPTMSRFWLVAQSTYNVGPYYTSYDFNGGNFSYGPNQVPQWPGIAGCKLSSVQGPSKTVLIAEYPA